MLFEKQLTTLPCGAKVATIHIPYVKSFSFGIWIKVGLCDEPENLYGIAHFMEHMVFKGSAKYSAEKISCLIEGNGGYLNAYTHQELTCFFVKAPSDRFSLASDIMLDIYLNPSLKKNDIKKEQAVILNELAMIEDDPDEQVEELLNSALWNNHPFARPISGYKSTVLNITQKVLLEFKKLAYIPEKTVFVCAGNLSHPECLDRIVNALDISKRQDLSENLHKRNIDKHQILQKHYTFKEKKIQQLQLALGFRACDRYDKSRYVFKLISVMLGENASSMLFQELREKHALCYSVDTALQLFSEAGALLIRASLNEKNLLKTLQIIVKVLKKIKSNQISQDTLDSAKKYIKGQFYMALETTSGWMSFLGEHVMFYNKIVDYEEILRAVDNVSLDDILAISKQIFVPEKLSIAILGQKIDNRIRKEAENIISQLGE